MNPERLPRSDRRSPLPATLAVGLAVTGLAVAVYWRVVGLDFVFFDDDAYVFDNAVVRQGLTRTGLLWAFSTPRLGNWHPLTWLSHMLDCELFGLWAGGHHLVSGLLHATNAALLFVALRGLTRRLWPCAFVAAIFAVHPLRVESVAWVAERKDLLSGLFFMLSLRVYASYARRPSVARLALLFTAMALGLMAKPMLVSLPAVLLLVDLWPLGRWQPGWLSADGRPRGTPLRRLVAEKLPLIGLSLASAAVTLAVQRAAGAIGSLDALPAGLRVGQALIAYTTYLWKTVWPTGLAFFYPHPVMSGQTLGPRIGLALMLLTAITTLAALQARRRPYLVVGWLWYLVTLLPVIGLIQVGRQAWADRYAYLPLIGIYVAVAWSAAELAGRRPRSRLAITAVALIALAASSAVTWTQIGHWMSTRSLAEHALRVTERNFVAHGKLGLALQLEGRTEEAAVQLERALEIDPRYAEAWINLGVVQERQGDLAGAQSKYVRAVELEPRNAVAHANLGSILMRQSRFDEALGHLAQALELRPDYVFARRNLGLLLEWQGELDRAAEQLETAARLSPDDVDIRYRLGLLARRRGRTEEAAEHFSRAVRMRPDHPRAHNSLGTAYVALRQLDRAAAAFARAIELDPGLVEAHYNLGLVRARQGNDREATAHFEQALRLDPGFAPARAALAGGDR